MRCKSLKLFTIHNFVPNLYNFICSVEPKRRSYLYAVFCHFWNLTALGHCSLSMYWKELLLSVSFWTVSYHWCPLYGQKTDILKSYRFGRTWRWIDKERIYISLGTRNTVRNQPLPFQWILSFWALVGLRVLDPPAKPKNGMRQVQRTSVQEGEREGQGPAH